MTNLVMLLLAIFAGVALLAWLLGRFGGEADPARTQRIARWIYPLVGLSLLLSMLQYFLQ